MKTLYVSKKILDWEASITGSVGGYIHNYKRPYEMVSHAATLISNGITDFSLSDAVANLKRALNHRLQAIESNYNLKAIKFDNMPKGYLELLEAYDLAKPFMIKRLMEIRNKIEHKDAKPPKKERCNELVDITWYFLKSTDRLLVNIACDIELYPYYSHNLPEKYSCTIRVDDSNKKLGLRGWIPKEYVLDSKNDAALTLKCSEIHDGEYWKNKHIEYHRDKTKDDLWLNGHFSDHNEKYLIFKKCFEAY